MVHATAAAGAKETAAAMRKELRKDLGGLAEDWRKELVEGKVELMREGVRGKKEVFLFQVVVFCGGFLFCCFVFYELCKVIKKWQFQHLIYMRSG